MQKGFDWDRLAALSLSEKIFLKASIDNVNIVSKFGAESDDEHTVYVMPEDGAVAEYIYIDGKPVCVGRSDVFELVNDLLARVEELENN